MSIDLLPFQTRAADQIARRFSLLVNDRRRPMEYADWPTPFYQALAGLTGSGKTPVLADAIAQIRAGLRSEPIVLWISKSKVVVDQTYANFEPGGKYENLIEGFLVTYLSQLTLLKIQDDTQPVIALSTVGAFNQGARSEGPLKVHRPNEQLDDESLWQVLRDRKARSSASRRPLLIVYDEGHNLTPQQTELLLELEPAAIMVASATMNTHGHLGRIIDRLKQFGWSESVGNDERDEAGPGLVTIIPSRDAVDAGLVKRQVILGGYATEMETALGDMLTEFSAASQKAVELQAGFLPKAIYVCRTNISQDDGTTDNPNRPFHERKAPPILIWRYLVEQAGIDPRDIAVYCDLRIDRRNNPAPADFMLFSGGEEEYAVFTEGRYRHIIFNLSLQEGWDDPACCFAYIDKSMGSPLQVEQVIGRVLRQPGAKHYADPDLNTANFYIRIDDRQEFPRILEVVRRKIAAEVPEVKLEGYNDGRDRNRGRLDPRETLIIPEIHIDADDALESLQLVVNKIHDYNSDAVNVLGPGELTRVVQPIGGGSTATPVLIEKEHSNRVVARWLIRRAMQALYPEAAKTVDWADPRFDAKVEVTSRAAAQLRDDAEKLVDTYLANAELSFEELNPFTVSSVLTKPEALYRFANSGHDGYSDLNTVELEFAQAIDSLNVKWVRNPSNGGFSIPLLEKGHSRRFFPDFIIWKDDKIYALDPKGDHLILKDAGHKLMNIRDERGRQRVIVRLITEGRWSHEPIKKLASGGYSVWRITGAGHLRCVHLKTSVEAVTKCLEG